MLNAQKASWMFPNRSTLLKFRSVSSLIPRILAIFILAAMVHPLAAQTWTATGSMNVARATPATLLDNGNVLVAGGCVPSISSAELYDQATGIFTFTGNMTSAHCGPTATLLQNGKVLITGGCNPPSTASAELYDPITGTFTATGNMTIPRANHTATLLVSGEVLITGGLSDCFSSGTVISQAELYDPTTGTFSPTGAMDFASYSQAAALLGNGEVLVMGGSSSGGCFSNADLYDPNTGTFTPTGNMTAGRFYHTATLLNNGQVLVAGGVCGNALSSAELYDPATGAFTLTGSMTTARYVHTATILNNGMVLIAGGNGLSGVLATAELYDSATGGFTTTGNMITARANHGATLLKTGNVLVAGGSNASGYLSGAELYQPIQTPAQLITALGNTVNSFDLQPGITNSLDAKLQAAQVSLAANDFTSACNQINAFLNEVSAQSGKKITMAQASQLIAQVNAIKAALGCP
jgi:galactose oxidase-like protein